MKDLLETPSIFLGLKNIEYFLFEEDFVEANMRCIPMVIRFKLDLVRIKLKLAEWAKLSTDEKMTLALAPCESTLDQDLYRHKLSQYIYSHMGYEPSELSLEKVNNDWSINTRVPTIIQQKANEFNWEVNLSQWAKLSELQRFCLLKLTNPGHENKNLPIAMKEFGWI